MHDFSGPAHIISVFDDIDIYNAPAFEAEVESAARSPFVVIDLSDCHYMESSGIAVLIRAYKRFGARLRIVVAAGSNIERVLRMTNLREKLPVAASRDEALALRSAS